MLALAREVLMSLVEILADRLEVGVARVAAPLGRDDLAAPLGDALDLGRRAERAGHVRRRRSGSQAEKSTGSGRSTVAPSVARTAVSQDRINSRWWAAVCLTSPASR